MTVEVPIDEIDEQACGERKGGRGAEGVTEVQRFTQQETSEAFQAEVSSYLLPSRWRNAAMCRRPAGP